MLKDYLIGRDAPANAQDALKATVNAFNLAFHVQRHVNVLDVQIVRRVMAILLQATALQRSRLKLREANSNEDTYKILHTLSQIVFNELFIDAFDTLPH